MQQAPSSTDPSRRQVLCGLAIALLAPGALAAACGGDSGGSGTGSGTTTGAAPTGGTTGGAAPTGGTTGGGTSAALAKMSDVPVGGGIIVDGGPSGKVLLVQPTAGTVKGYDPTCTHQRFTVDPPKDGVINCVQGHGSQFDPADGSVRKGPAAAPLATVNVKVDGTDVVLA